MPYSSSTWCGSSSTSRALELRLNDLEDVGRLLLVGVAVQRGARRRRFRALGEVVEIDDDALPRSDRDADEQEAADILEVDQTELEELGLVLDDPHQVDDE